MNMFRRMGRRQFLGGLAQLSLAAGLAPMLGGRAGANPTPAKSLTVGTRVLEVQGKPATVFGQTGQDGRSGLELWQSEDFNIRLMNEGPEPTIIHWHGLTPPFSLDGSNVSQDPIAPGASADYAFALERAGTNWMHSRLGLQEQSLLAAPLIVRDDAERDLDRQEVVVLLHDFTFTPPAEILERLISGEGGHIGSGTAATERGMVRAPAAGMDHAAMGHGGMAMGGGATDTGGGMAGMNDSACGMAGMAGGAMGGSDMEAMSMDINDVDYDVFLANDRTLDDPEVVAVERGGRVRLRVINAGTSTNFWLDLGALTGTLVAADGRGVTPIRGRRFEMAMAQRLDIDLEVPGRPPSRSSRSAKAVGRAPASSSRRRALRSRRSPAKRRPRRRRCCCNSSAGVPPQRRSRLVRSIAKSPRT